MKLARVCKWIVLSLGVGYTLIQLYAIIMNHWIPVVHMILNGEGAFPSVLCTLSNPSPLDGGEYGLSTSVDCTAVLGGYLIFAGIETVFFIVYRWTRAWEHRYSERKK